LEKKGWGIKTNEVIHKGDFVIEYTGEVISTHTCLERLAASKGEKNFYFLTLDSSECIDASKKGSLGRYINHSCNPNCETQKWSVNGELRIGIFAVKQIQIDTEVTFDYQFERLGSRKQKCYCGESNCRGVLGIKRQRKANVYKKSKLQSKNEGTIASNISFQDQLIAIQTIDINKEKRGNKLYLVRNLIKGVNYWNTILANRELLPIQPKTIVPDTVLSIPSVAIERVIKRNMKELGIDLRTIT